MQKKLSNTVEKNKKKKEGGGGEKIMNANLSHMNIKSFTLVYMCT